MSGDLNKGSIPYIIIIIIITIIINTNSLMLI